MVLIGEALVFIACCSAGAYISKSALYTCFRRMLHMGEAERGGANGVLESLSLNVIISSTSFDDNANLIDGISIFNDSISQSRTHLTTNTTASETKESELLPERKTEDEATLDFELISDENSENEYTSFNYSEENIQFYIDKDNIYNRIREQMRGED